MEILEKLPHDFVTESDAVDLSLFDEMCALVGHKRIDELLGMLADELMQTLEPLPSAARELANRAHSMVSTAGALGFIGFSDLCREVEHACLSGQENPSLLERLTSGRNMALAQIEALRLMNGISAVP